jgi:hypothetical protein
VIFLFILIFRKAIYRYLITRSVLPISLNFQFIGILSFLSFRAVFCLANLDYH